MRRLTRIVLGGLTGIALLAATAACDPGYEEINYSGITDEPYGCLSENTFEETEAGTYEGEADCRYFVNPTGIAVRDGDFLNVDVSGSCCWANYLCSDADGDEDTWGIYWLFRKDGSDTAYNYAKLGKNFSGTLHFPDQDTYRVFLVVPELDDKDVCNEYSYQNNSGTYSANIKID